jgi:hypothetical protein
MKPPTRAYATPTSKLRDSQAAANRATEQSPVKTYAALTPAIVGRGSYVCVPCL